MANHPMLSPFKSPVQSLHWPPNGMVEMKTNPTNKRPKHIFRRVTITTPPPRKQQCHNLAAASTLDTVLHTPTLKPQRSFQALTSFTERYNNVKPRNQSITSIRNTFNHCTPDHLPPGIPDSYHHAPMAVLSPTNITAISQLTPYLDRNLQLSIPSPGPPPLHLYINISPRFVPFNSG